MNRGDAVCAVRPHDCHVGHAHAPDRFLLNQTHALDALLVLFGLLRLLHFRGAYHNPAMFLPVTIPPAGAALLLHAAYGAKDRNRFLARWWLRIVAWLGVAGMGFHAWGVQRNMGGWRNWRQNVLNGPPIPAPPSFLGLALAGLAALGLLDDHPDG